MGGCTGRAAGKCRPAGGSAGERLAAATVSGCLAKPHHFLARSSHVLGCSCARVLMCSTGSRGPIGKQQAARMACREPMAAGWIRNQVGSARRTSCPLRAVCPYSFLFRRLSHCSRDCYVCRQHFGDSFSPESAVAAAPPIAAGRASKAAADCKAVRSGAGRW